MSFQRKISIHSATLGSHESNTEVFFCVGVQAERPHRRQSSLLAAIHTAKSSSYNQTHCISLFLIQSEHTRFFSNSCCVSTVLLFIKSSLCMICMAHHQHWLYMIWSKLQPVLRQICSR